MAHRNPRCSLDLQISVGTADRFVSLRTLDFQALDLISSSGHDRDADSDHPARSGRAFLVAGRLFLLHAFAAATQDVSIDAFCISTVQPDERGQLNAWMQVGMFTGRALLGGGALILFNKIGFGNVVVLLMFCIASPSLLIIFFTKVKHHIKVELQSDAPELSIEPQQLSAWRKFAIALSQSNTWLAIAFALLGGAAFKSFEIIYGPMLKDAGSTEIQIGRFAALPWIICMVAGALIGGYVADRFDRRVVVGSFAIFAAASIAMMALIVDQSQMHVEPHWWWMLCVVASAIGLLTSSSYALFMDLSLPATAATQYSGYMGATNGCESWSSFVIGNLIAKQGYSVGIWTMCGVSLAAIILLPLMRLPKIKEELKFRVKPRELASRIENLGFQEARPRSSIIYKFAVMPCV